jgi:hypothetical protein
MKARHDRVGQGFHRLDESLPLITVCTETASSRHRLSHMSTSLYLKDRWGFRITHQAAVTRQTALAASSTTAKV